ncbi:tRNA lysidine(34) synthetase TilS [Sedimenticola selenatireducens]|uniref:tRNA lysidine(34) synthetase TilS n=1 Tax=Sedimenticola selenatireducens TaxID=191960 RepID=UPI0004AF2037|nr:tRNA lysidine(34) synthetase TilS [Sedimenticola selenatireducens]
MSFSPDHLLNTLSKFSLPTGYLIGFSGGMDSHVLLYAMVVLGERLPAPLRAIHVDHGLQSQSTTWAGHCQSVCRKLNIPLETFSLQLKPIKGESLEAVAREARYGVLAREIRPGEMLLTAHHQDDQAETLLLQLLRGAGLSGLAAMPELTRFDKGIHARPLLDSTRNELTRYATDVGLHWIEDASNQDIEFDRNYLRHQVVPLLKARWPAMSRTLSRSAGHCAEADRLIEALLSRELEQIHDPADGTLCVSLLNALPAGQLAALLRLWIGRSGYALPGSAILERIITEVLGSRLDGNPLVSWRGAEIRRYRDRLYLMSPLPSFDPCHSLVWRGESELSLPAGLGTLRFQDNQGVAGVSPEPGRYRIRFRQGGETCRPLGRGINKKIKHLLQEAGVLPWMRERVPLLEVDGEIAEIIGVCRCEPDGQAPIFRHLKITWNCPLPWRRQPPVKKPD